MTDRAKTQSLARPRVSWTVFTMGAGTLLSVTLLSVTLLSVTLLSVALPDVAVGQKLQAVRQEIHTSDSSPPAIRQSESAKEKKRRRKKAEQQRLSASHSYFETNEDEEDLTLSEQLATVCVTAAGAITHAVFIGDPHAQGFDINYELEPAEPQGVPASPNAPSGQISLYFAHYPYADGFNGYAMESGYVPARPLTAVSQIQVSFGSDFDSLQWYTGKGLFEWSRSRFGFDAEWTYFNENLGGGLRDELHVGDVNLLWRRIQSVKWLMRWGVGMIWSHDDTGTDAGINGTLKVDYFPTRPIVVSGEYDLGLLGNATAQHLQLGVGATWNHVELFSAYDYRRFDRVDLSGPVFGLRFWW